MMKMAIFVNFQKVRYILQVHEKFHDPEGIIGEEINGDMMNA